MFIDMMDRLRFFRLGFFEGFLLAGVLTSFLVVWRGAGLLLKKVALVLGLSQRLSQRLTCAVHVVCHSEFLLDRVLCFLGCC